MSIKDNFPAVRPQLLIDIANTEVLDPRVVSSRASVATYYDKFGVLQTASANEPRIGYNPVTGAVEGLIREAQGTNLVTYSEDFSNGAWVKEVSATVTTNTLVAPDGTLTMDALNITSSGAIYQAVTVGSLVPHTFSQYLKKGSLSSVILQGYDTNYWARTTFNLETGTITSVQDGTATIEYVGNGVYKCSVTGTPNSLSTLIFTVPQTAGNCYLWGAQLEAGSFPTSYIKTEASQVTRSADSASMTGTNFSDWYRQDEGSFYAEATQLTPSASYFPVLTGLGRTINEFININLGPSYSLYVYNFSSQAILNADDTTQGVVSKIVGVYRTNDFAVCVDSGVIVTAMSGIVPFLTSLSIGRDQGATTLYSGYIKKIAYYPTRLSNENLQALTS